jgi:hypothetical protein
MARVVIIPAFAVMSFAVSVAPSAGAAPPEDPHGVGVCFSQLAIDPSLVGAARLGDVLSSIAGPGQPGSDVPGALDGARGDGPTGCGAPPGPGHLGG